MHKSLMIFTLLAVVTSTAAAVESKVSYGDFYKRLAVVEKESLKKVAPAFYLLKLDSSGPCLLSQVHLETNSQRVDVVQESTGELHIPFDAQLKQDKAELVMDFPSEPNCAMSIQTKLVQPLTELTSVDSLSEVANELNLLVRGHAGFWGKMFLPDFKGISLQLVAGSNEISIMDTVFVANNNQVKLSNEWLANNIGKPLNLPSQVIDIKPWLENK